jgi:general stress protein 26
MKTETQGVPELARLSELIENQSVAMMTTVGTDGSLHSRPMAPLQMDASGALWFFTDMRSAKMKHLKMVNLSFADTERSAYVSLSGRCEIHADAARIETLWAPFARPWFPEGPDSEHLALLKFVPEGAEAWDASHGKMVRMLARAASVAAARPIALGQHQAMHVHSARSQRTASA